MVPWDHRLLRPSTHPQQMMMFITDSIPQWCEAKAGVGHFGANSHQLASTSFPNYHTHGSLADVVRFITDLLHGSLADVVRLTYRLLPT